jgi:tetratricopeptide (TPR) repeat protein
LKCTLLFELAEVFKNTGSYQDAADFYGRAVATDGCSKILHARSLNGIGDVHRARGEFAQAMARYAESENMGVELGDSRMCCEVWTDLSELFEWKCQEDKSHGRTNEAAEFWNKAKNMAEKVIQEGPNLGMWDNVRRAYVIAGNLCIDDGRLADAEEPYKKATALADKYGLDQISVNNIGELLRYDGRFMEAGACYTKYLDWSVRTGAVRQEIIARTNLGLVALGQHEYENARDIFNKALDLNASRRHASASLFAYAGKGVSFEMQNALAAADEMYREALASAGIDHRNLNPLEVRARLGEALSGYAERQLAEQLLSQHSQDASPHNPETAPMPLGGT